MSQGWYRHVAHLLVLAFLLNAFPAARLLAAPSALPAILIGDSPPATVLTVPPVTDPHLPSLSLDLTVAPDPLPIGDTATISLTLSNSAPDPAQDLVVTLPTPDGALALNGSATISPVAGWQWNLATLAARSSTTLTAT